jgi:hypothetical protein
MRGKEGPMIIGCSGCGVPDRIARMWPEPYRTMMYRLSGKKLEALIE